MFRVHPQTGPHSWAQRNICSLITCELVTHPHCEWTLNESGTELVPQLNLRHEPCLPLRLPNDVTYVSALEAFLNPKQKQGIRCVDLIWILERWHHCTSRRIRLTRFTQSHVWSMKYILLVNTYFSLLRVIALIYLQNLKTTLNK